MKYVVPRVAGAALGLLALAAPTALASQLVPQNLTQMIRASDVILMGEVAKVSDGIERGVPYTEVTLKVKGSLKRQLKEKSMYSFRQYGLLKPRKMPDGRFMLPARIEGMPTWTVGESVTTFLNKPSAHNGLTSPVGLAQGKLTMGADKASNSFHNQGLFKGVTVEGATLSTDEKKMIANPNGAVSSGVFLGLLKRAVKEQWVEKGVMR